MLFNFYFHVNSTHDSFNAMKSDAAIEHAKGAPNTILSVVLNSLETEVFVKVTTTDENYNPDWGTAPFVIRKYTEADHNEAVTMLNGDDWIPPGYIDL